MIVCPDNGGLPPAVIPTGITLIQLKSVRFIVSREEGGNAEGTQPAVLGVGLFVVADVLDEIFDGDGFLVLVGVATGAETGLID